MILILINISSVVHKFINTQNLLFHKNNKQVLKPLDELQALFTNPEDVIDFMNLENLKYEIARENDISELTKVMTLTFDHDTQVHLGEPKGGPPGYDTGEFFQRWMIEEEDAIGYKIILGERIIGAFIVFISKTGNNVLGSMFILPEYQNMGIGTRTWQYIEETYPNALSWTLETPSWTTRNHHFYEKKCGFSKTREEPLEGAPGTLFIYRKSLP